MKTKFYLSAALVILMFSLLAGCSQEQPKEQELPNDNVAPDVATSPDPTPEQNATTPAPTPATTPKPAEPKKPAPTPPQEPKTSTPKPQVRTFSISARKFEFAPNALKVNKGDTVKISITSSDVPHGFNLSAFGINKTITPGETATVEFVADKTGSFPFFCSVFCGSGHSTMRGTLVVE